MSTTRTYRRSDGSPIKEVYGPEDIAGNTAQQQGLPALYPYTRGIHPSMYRGRLWTMRQYAGFASAQESNQRYHELLKAGQTGLSVAFDLPTQMGFDPDQDMARGEVGKVGVSIATIDDMRALLKDIPLDQVSVSMTINATAAILLCFYVALAEEQGVAKDQLRGTLQNDLLKEYMARGTYIYPVEPSLRLATDVIEYCSHSLPKFNPISISGYHIREAGSTAVQEVAFTLANAICYLRRALARGLDIDQFAPQLSFFFAAHNDLIEEVAKFRAARTLWSQITREQFGAKEAKAMQMRFHVQTGGSTLTAQQIDNNVVRTSVQALSAVLGGCQSLHTNAKDEALSLPSQESATLALRTQQIIAEESGIPHTVDPFAGSYAVEAETQRIMDEAQTLLRHIEDLGGSPAALAQNYFQNALAESAYKVQQEIDAGEKRIVGLNCYQQKEQNSQKPEFSFSEEREQKRRQSLIAFKNGRDSSTVEVQLSKLKSAARSNTNLVPAILECVRAGCSLGEISGSLKELFGQYQAP